MNAIEETRRLIRRYNIRANKRFGQNFLIDPDVLETILETSGVGKDDFVLEIGPGPGVLTRSLCERAGKVLAVEIDYDMVDILEKELLPLYDNLEILAADILKVDIRQIAKQQTGDVAPIRVVANLPYYVTTPILMELLENRNPIRSITVMVQKEVADRMMAAPGSKECGAISLAVQYYAEVSCAMTVPPSAFVPSPNVESAVMHLRIREVPPVEVQDEKIMFSLIRAGFEQRRKTLVNAIGNNASNPYDKEQVRRALTELGLSEDIRGEKLSLAEYSGLSDILNQ